MAEGRKDDSGKLRFDLFPVEPLMNLAEVYTIGSKKYSDRNWEKGIQYGRVFAALMRHAWKWWRGQQRDEVDGQHHLASVAWCAFALMEYERTHPELDDRPRASGSVPDATGDSNELGGQTIDASGNSHSPEDVANGHHEQPSYSTVPNRARTLVSEKGPTEGNWKGVIGRCYGFKYEDS